MNGFLAVIKKEFTHLFRDRGSLILALLVPILQVCLYGYAIDFDVRHIPTVLVDQDRSRESRQYVDQLHATQYLDFEFTTQDPSEAAQIIRAGHAQAAVIIPPSFARDQRSGNGAHVGVLVDGSDSQVSLRAANAFRRPSTIKDPRAVDPRVTVLFNPNSRTAVYMIPGLIGLILAFVLSSLTSGSIVREREQGSLEQLMVSPVGKYALMVGKLVPFFVLALFEMFLILGLGYVLFDVRPVGSVPLLVFMSIPFIIAVLAQGLFISTVAQNQAQALQLSTLSVLPTILLSGFIFPRATLPGFLWLISNIFPITHELIILRGVVVRGAGFTDLIGPFLAQSAIAVGLIWLASRRFQKSIA